MTGCMKMGVLAAIVGLLGCAPDDNISTKTSALKTSSMMLNGVTLRPGVTTDISVVLFKTKKNCNEYLLAVHGMTAGASSWERFAGALLKKKNKVLAGICGVAAFDMPGHGGSSLPTNLLFEHTLVDDHVTTLLQVLTRLKKHKIKSRMVVGHSMGGLTVILAQQRLKDQGTTLKKAHKIKKVVLLGPAVPSPVAWPFADTGQGATLLANYITYTPQRGYHVAAPDQDWLFVWFSNKLGALAQGSPSLAEIAQKEYNQPEPLLASLQVAGAPPFSRSSAASGLFSKKNKTELHLVGFEHDLIIASSVEQSLYNHLVGGKPHAASASYTIMGPDAVHDTYIADPEAILSALGR